MQDYYSRIYKTYDLVNAIFTLGLDKKWREITVKECLKDSPAKVLDLCCGTGDLAIKICLAAEYDIKVKGYDLNSDMLGVARHKAESAGVHPEFIRGDASSMPFKNQEFDCITIGFGFRNLTWSNPGRNLHIAEMNRVLKPGGRLLILESSQPEKPLLRFFYKLYLRFVLIPLGGLISGDWNAYRYLAGSSNAFYRFSELQQLLAGFNFNLSLKKRFLAGSANLLVATKVAG